MSRKLKNKLIALTFAAVVFVAPLLIAGVSPVVAIGSVAVVYYLAK